MAGIEFRDGARLVSCRDFAEAEGLTIRNNRIACPFHGGKNYNFALFDDGRGHCFVCGRDADSVRLAAAVWRTNQRDAAVELNERFRLGLQAETMTQAERDRREQARNEARELQKRVKQAEAQEYSAACDDERTAQREIEQFSIEDADKPAFDQALQRLCAAQLRCDVLQVATGGR